MPATAAGLPGPTKHLPDTARIVRGGEGGVNKANRPGGGRPDLSRSVQHPGKNARHASIGTLDGPFQTYRKRPDHGVSCGQSRGVSPEGVVKSWRDNAGKCDSYPAMACLWGPWCPPGAPAIEQAARASRAPVGLQATSTTRPAAQRRATICLHMAPGPPGRCRRRPRDRGAGDPARTTRSTPRTGRRSGQGSPPRRMWPQPTDPGPSAHRAPRPNGRTPGHLHGGDRTPRRISRGAGSRRGLGGQGQTNGTRRQHKSPLHSRSPSVPLLCGRFRRDTIPVMIRISIRTHLLGDDAWFPLNHRISSAW